MSDATSRFVDVEGVRLHVVVEGRGPAVVVLHGFTGDAESMEPVAAALRGTYRVFRVELVGHGESDAPTQAAPYAMGACVGQIVAVVEALGLRCPHLLGYSMGGRAALAAAVARPAAFASLVLVGASAGLDDPADREERIAADRALADRIERDGLERFVDDWMALPLFASQARLGSDALARARAQRLRARPHGLANSLRGMGTGAQPSLHARLPGLDLPVLLVVGEEDAKFRAVAQAMADLLPDARVCTLPDSGHAVHLEAPAAFGARVHRFLAEVGSRVPPVGASSR